MHEAASGKDCRYGDSFCDYTTPTDDGWDTRGDDDDGLLYECGDAMRGCFNDEECYECLTSGSSESDDDVTETCGGEPGSSDTCSEWAEFLCCAIEESMDEECKDNDELMEWLGESTLLYRLLWRGCENQRKALSIQWLACSGTHLM